MSQKLEAQNRRLKRAGIAALLVVAAVLVMGQAKTERGIECTSFVLEDDAKNIRASLFTGADGSTKFVLSDAKGKFQTVLSAGGDQLGLNISDISSSGKGKFSTLTTGSVGLTLMGPAGSFGVSLYENGGGPSLFIEDKDGYSSVIGRTEMVSPNTGRKTGTPAAAITLFGKDKKVLWSAP